MSATDFAMVDVFCHDGGGGNPTGLVLEADALSADDMQDLAKQCGHESGFVLRPRNPDTADFRFRYFVPRHEMEMCGHATVGALWLMREQGRIDAGTYRIETESGLVAGHVGAQVEITQPIGTTTDVSSMRDDILSVLGIDATALAAAPIENARTSRTKTLVPIKDAETLNRIAPDFGRMEGLCQGLDSTGLYPYAVLSETEKRYEARQFPRASGYPEDAATGIAATALASALRERGAIARPEAGAVIYQGRAMGRLSEIRVRFGAVAGDGGAVECLLSGDAQLVG